MEAGMIGAIAGGVLGCMGGVIGTYFSVVNASQPRERALTIRFAVACGLWLAAAGAVALLAPRPWNQLAASAGLLSSMVPWCNRKLAQARAEDEAEQAASSMSN